jgi:transcriptional regulator with XRE-family HTH domain
MADKEAMLFGRRLKELRAAAGLSQEELADQARHPLKPRLQVSLATVRNLEQGRVQPAFDTAVALAGGLGVSVAALAERPESPPEPPRRGRPPADRGSR